MQPFIWLLCQFICTLRREIFKSWRLKICENEEAGLRVSGHTVKHCAWRSVFQVSCRYGPAGTWNQLLCTAPKACVSYNLWQAGCSEMSWLLIVSEIFVQSRLHVAWSLPVEIQYSWVKSLDELPCIYMAWRIVNRTLSKFEDLSWPRLMCPTLQHSF